MRRIYLAIVALVLLSFLVIGCDSSRRTYDDQVLPEFILGKWRATRQATSNFGNYIEEDFLKFMPNGKLLYCRKNPVEPFCASFSYTFLKENMIWVYNKRMTGGSWTLFRANDRLEVCVWNVENCKDFSRDESGLDILLEIFHIFR